MLFPSHIPPYDVDVDCVFFGHGFEWSNTIHIHARVTDLDAKTQAFLLQMKFICWQSYPFFFEFLLFVFSCFALTFCLFYVVLGLTNNGLFEYEMKQALNTKDQYLSGKYQSVL